MKMEKYYIDEFVNYIAPSRGRCIDMSTQVKTNDLDVLHEQLPSEFANRFEWDSFNERAFPVMIWEKAGEPVAYWDCEYCVGYFMNADVDSENV
jgi:hypothetical protein